jgi:hypothetical protein
MGQCKVNILKLSEAFHMYDISKQYFWYSVLHCYVNRRMYIRLGFFLYILDFYKMITNNKPFITLIAVS